LRTLYPEHSWQSLNFVEDKALPYGHWQDKTNLLQALSQAEDRLGLQKVRNKKSKKKQDAKRDYLFTYFLLY